MIGTFEGVELTFGSFGQQYTTIDGRKYVTRFDFMDPKLKGLESDVMVEFEAQSAPTVLCDSSRISVDLPRATLLRVEGAR